MTVTPVGMRCPECAKQRTEVRRVAHQGFNSAGAPATMALVGANVVVFLIQWLTGGGLMSIGGPMYADFALYGPAVADGEWWRLVTGGFLHAGLIHLALNMFLLYILGTLVEPLIGTRRFVAIYFVALLAGSAGALLLDPNAFTVGASGAVFGLMAAGFLVSRDRGLDELARQIGILVVFNIFITFAIPRISIGGHLGGLLGGALAALLILRVRHIGGLSRAQRSLVESGGLILLAVASVAIAIGAVSG